MAQDKITEIFDIQAIEANIAKAISAAKSALPELEKLGQNIKANTTISGASNNTAAANAAMVEFTKNLKDYTEAVKLAAAARFQLSKISDEDAAKQKVNSTALNAQLKEEIKLTSNLTGAYQKLNIQHKQAVKAYQDAAAAGKLSAQQLGLMKDKANELGQQLVKIDAGVGNYKRNVGNYSSAWNGLGNSINQVARELPNFTQSMQLGFLAISNNLPILADEISNTKKQIAALKAEGKDVPSLFSQIAKSAFSWQTLLVVGITLLTKYGAEFTNMIVDYVSGTSEAVRAQEALNKTYRDSAVTGAIANVKQLGLDIQLAKDNIIDKDRVLKEYNDTIGKVAGEVKNWSDLEQAYIDNSDKYIQFTLLRAAANYAFEESAKKSVDALINAQKSIQTASKINAANINPLNIGTALFSALTAKNAQEESDQLLNIAKDFRTRAANIFDVNDALTPSKEKKAARKKDVKEIGKDLVDIYTQVRNSLNDFEQDEIDIRSRTLAYLRTQLKAGLISTEQYENQKKVIIENSEAEILRNQVAFLGKTLANYGFSAENTAKITELWQNKMIALKKSEADAEEAQTLITAKNLEGFQAAMYKRKEKQDKDAADKEKSIQEQKNKYIQELAQETSTLIFTLLDAQTQKEISAAEKRSEALSAEYDLKRKAVEQASLSDQEKTARKLVLDAEEAESQRKIDNEIRALKIKQAKFDKAQALATIAINAAIALASAQNLGTLGALSPFIIGLAAAQAAIVLATPLPEYAKGKKASDSYEGLAIAGEKGTEMKIDKDGSLQLLTKPTLIHTKRGDTILSNRELMSGELGKHIKTGKEKANYDELIKAYSYHTDRTIKAIKNSPSNIIIDNSNYNLSLKRARV
jgi:hypothetical protein